MKRIYIIIFGILALTSCQYKVDNSNPFKVAEAIHEGLVRNDSTILQNVFEFQMDSFSVNSREKLSIAKDFFEKNNKITIFKTDTSSREYSREKEITIFYKKGKNFYQIRAFYFPDSTNTIKPQSFYFNNINELCERDSNEPYKPTYSIDFKSINWHTDYYSTSFKDGAIELQNNTDLDLNYIKFRVILKNGSSSWSAKTFLNQTVESYKPIYKGDIVKIDVPGMTDYYTGFKINKDELFFNAELIEVKPKPEPYWCKVLKDLQNEVIEKGN